MLQKIKALDPDQNNIVKFIENFWFKNMSCLAFEMLDRSLHALMKENKFTLKIPEIGYVTQQLLVAFDGLKNIGILHTDLKPDNIMLVNHTNLPFKIKLIDFGLALPVSQLKVGMTMQATAFRAPEVVLGLPLSEAVDMWGVGCVMAYMYFGNNLFPNSCKYHWMETVVRLLGQPDDHQLLAGKYSRRYFICDDQTGVWRLRTQKEYHGRTNIAWTRFNLAKNLEDAIKVNEPEDMAFFDFLKCCLHTSAEHRISPKDALNHRFITGVHLVYEEETKHLDKSNDSPDQEDSHAVDMDYETERESANNSWWDEETRHKRNFGLCLKSNEGSAPTGSACTSAMTLSCSEGSELMRISVGESYRHRRSLKLCVNVKEGLTSPGLAYISNYLILQ
ncbi:homeodomain-interacting protein kinase 1-like [Hippoglossus stenolepis]|uniref:homeodomain-interacting protein kinase 1-like n=1 Tax=Hippoglossus stenolepis TaxID=195615 RepID=UPI00159C6543|nr:homeodomain-interacting protein kinase 1-like [Hippoglossus stenolepis]